jgi:hypothetical protein
VRFALAVVSVLLVGASSAAGGSDTIPAYIRARSGRPHLVREMVNAPRWGFCPRVELEALGKVRLMCALPPTDTGAMARHYEMAPPHHLGMTVWGIDTPASSLDLKVNCVRLLVPCPDGQAKTHRRSWSGQSRTSATGKGSARKVHKFIVCGREIELRQGSPPNQDVFPFVTYWTATTIVGGWAVYVKSPYRTGEDSDSAAISAIKAMDCVTAALRECDTHAPRPFPIAFAVTDVEWRNQEVTCSFRISSSPGKEVVVHVWNRVPREYSTTGIRGYTHCTVKADPDRWTKGCRITVSCPWGMSGLSPTQGREAFRTRQFDWADEYGVGASSLHDVKHNAGSQ